MQTNTMAEKKKHIYVYIYKCLKANMNLLLNITLLIIFYLLLQYMLPSALINVNYQHDKMPYNECPLIKADDLYKYCNRCVFFKSYHTNYGPQTVPQAFIIGTYYINMTISTMTLIFIDFRFAPMNQYLQTVQYSYKWPIFTTYLIIRLILNVLLNLDSIEKKKKVLVLKFFIINDFTVNKMQRVTEIYIYILKRL